MIRLNLKDKSALDQWLFRLLSDVPSATWAVVCRGNGCGFDLLLFGPHVANMLVNAAEERIAEAVDRDSRTVTDAVLGEVNEVDEAAALVEGGR